jgi:hypothetical protein
MHNEALIFKKGFGKDESVVIISPKNYNILLHAKKNTTTKALLKRFPGNKIEVCGIEFIVDDGPLLTSSRSIKFFYEEVKIFEFRAPKLSERFNFHFVGYSCKGFVFVGSCNHTFPKIDEIVLSCLDSFRYFGEPEAW